MNCSKCLNHIEKSPSAQHQLACPFNLTCGIIIQCKLLCNKFFHTKYIIGIYNSGSAILDGTKLNVDTFTDHWLQIKASYLKPLCCCQNENVQLFCKIVKNLATQLKFPLVCPTMKWYSPNGYENSKVDLTCILSYGTLQIVAHSS